SRCIVSVGDVAARDGSDRLAGRGWTGLVQERAQEADLLAALPQPGDQRGPQRRGGAGAARTRRITLRHHEIAGVPGRIRGYVRDDAPLQTHRIYRRDVARLPGRSRIDCADPGPGTAVSGAVTPQPGALEPQRFFARR